MINIITENGHMRISRSNGHLITIHSSCPLHFLANLYAILISHDLL